MKKIIALLIVSAVVAVAYAGRVSYQGDEVTATTTTNKYQIGTANSDFVTEVSIKNNGANVVFVMPNVATNAVTTAIPVRDVYTFKGDNIFWLSYYTTNGTSDIDIAAEGY